MDNLIQSLIGRGVLRTPAVVEALQKTDRANFVPEKLKSLAYADKALPIGYGQTISQPFTVIFMLELLEPQKGNHILDIGSGSMWQSALLAEIVGDAGKVYSMEINPDVFKIGKENIFKYPNLLGKIEMYCQSGEEGLPQTTKNTGGFDRIIAAAEVRKRPRSWGEQLKRGGRLVYPQNGSIFLEIKKSEDCFEVTEFPGFAFVPFICK